MRESKIIPSLVVVLETHILTGGSTDPLCITEFAERIIEDGFKFSLRFVDIMRRKYLQYWLVYPYDSFRVTTLLYYSRQHNAWYSIIPSEQFRYRLFYHQVANQTQMHFRKNIVFQSIQDGDSIEQQDEQIAPYVFTEEMVATALVELMNGRMRSAVLHAVIALELSAKKGLEILISRQLAGLNMTTILELISKEVSTVTLAQVVYTQLVLSTGAGNVDWAKIKALHNTRNMIVHRGQRRQPNFNDTMEQMTEILKCVSLLEEAIRCNELNNNS